MFDCGDNSCRFAKNKTGMRTNGGCRCFENPVVKAKITMIVNAFSDGDLINIKTATAEELLQNESVKMLVERLHREIRNGMNHFDDCKVFFEDADGFDIDANESEICNCGAAWEYNQSLEALKKFEVKE